MDYRVLGRTGIKVSPLCLGTMNFGGPTNESDSIKIIHAALDAGINFVDTADMYNAGVSEVVVGKALQHVRDKVILTSKVYFPTSDDPNDRGASRRHILRACEASLRRLNTETIDLYQIHRSSPDIPVDETLRALDDLVRSGKVIYIGCSTHPAWMVMEAISVSERYGYARYISEQPPYNLLDRRIENELVPLAMKYGLAIIPWAPLGQGLLAGRYPASTVIPDDSRAGRLPGSVYAERITKRGIEAGKAFTEIARMFGKSPGQLALVWCKDQPGITAPIIGPRTIEHLHDLLPALEMCLSQEEREACDAINPPGGVIADFHNTAGWMKTQVL